MRWLCLTPIVLTGCNGFSETLATPEGQVAAQQITENAVDAAVQAVGGNWTSAIASAATAAAGVLAFIRYWRGGIGSRKGVIPARVSMHPDS